MDVTELRRALKSKMGRLGLTYVDVASRCKVGSPDTVERFVTGETKKCHRLTREAYERFVNSDDLVSAESAQSTSKAV
jgi:hypothetical protein